MENTLKELGYIKHDFSLNQYYKRVKGNTINLDITDLESAYITINYMIFSEQEIIDLKKTYNIMKKDIKEIKKHYEHNK